MNEPELSGSDRSPRRDKLISRRWLIAPAIGFCLAAILQREPAEAPVPPASVTIDGLLTAGCVEQDDTFTLPPGKGFYLGAMRITEGVRSDFFRVSNRQGAIIYEQSPDDAGQVAQVEGGFDYTENGDIYRVLFTNWDHALYGVIAVTVLADCHEADAPGLHYI